MKEKIKRKGIRRKKREGSTEGVEKRERDRVRHWFEEWRVIGRVSRQED